METDYTKLRHLRRERAWSSRELAQRTFERYYESIVRVHIKPALGRVRLGALTPNHVRRLYRQKLDSGLAPAPSTTFT